MIWFTSDTHFGHANIIKYCNRPFSNVNDMNEGIVKNINSLVAKNDVLYHLGDFTFGPRNETEYLSCLRRHREKIACNNVHLLWGNHDKKNLFHDYGKLFSSLSDLREITVFNRRIVLCHYAMRVWNASHKDSWHLYGHSHGSLPDDPNSLSIDVGIDCFDCKPISFDQVEEIMSKKPTYRKTNMAPTIKASIVISSYNRLGLFRRTLWSIANKGPSVPFEVIIVDDNSTEDILSELKLYSSRFYWKFVKFDAKKFEETTGMTKFLNNPCTTNNIGVKLSRGDLIFQQGNEIIAFDGCYDQLIKDVPDSPYFMVMSTTYDVPGSHLNSLDQYGSNVSSALLEKVKRWPLQDKHYRSDVTNYISLAGKNVWEALGGCDERYYGGISAEDSDFVRRARTLPGFKQVISDGVSLHQYHSGKTCYYDPPASVITKDRWNEGVEINHAIYHNWDGKTTVPSKWDWGTLGIGEIITNG